MIQMPVNSFLVQGNMIKHKTLPFYETCILNYDIRRRTNPVKVKEFMYEQGTIRPIMHAGSLWEKVKNFFKKGKNAITKTMDFIDNNEVLKDFKDSALNYIGNKTGVDVNKIYDTTHQIMDALPTYTVEQKQPDAMDYYNQRQQYMGNKYGNQYNYYDPYGSQQNYSKQSSQNVYPYQQPNSQNSFQNQLTNTYNRLQNEALSAPQKQQVKQNFDLFANGLKSCGMDLKTAFNMNKTLAKNIPKMLMMGINPGTGKISIHGSYKPILEKFGHHSLIVPKTIKDMMEKLKIDANQLMHNPGSVSTSSKGRLNLGKGETELAGNNNERVNTSKSSNQLGSTNNNAPTQVKPSSLPSTGKCGKQSRYADILGKLAARPVK
jgi:hypothetical protein